MTLTELAATATAAGMEVRYIDGGLELLAPGANLWVDAAGEVRILAQGSRAQGEAALRALASGIKGGPQPVRTQLDSVRRLALKALLLAQGKGLTQNQSGRRKESKW